MDENGRRSREEKDDRKARLKQEARDLGISYEEMKKRDKKRLKRETDSLENEEHEKEVKRMRAYSRDENDEDDEHEREEKRRRTRSMDAAEEKKVMGDEDGMTPDEWRKSHNITVQGHGANRNIPPPPPYMRFEEAPFNPAVQRSFKQAGFDKPTPIQAQAWPVAIQRKDMICIAKTGSGKTCGFLLPSFHQHLEKEGANNGHGGLRRGGFMKPVLLVLAPTRELSVQIMEECQKFGRSIGIRSVCCYGGSSKYPQIAALERGVEVVIATPGRLNDLLEMRKADLSNIQYLVLDEADRMLDMVCANFCMRHEYLEFLSVTHD